MPRIFADTSWILDTTSLKALAPSGDNFRIATTSSTVMIFKTNITNIIENAVEAKRMTLLREKNESKSIISKEILCEIQLRLGCV